MKYLYAITGAGVDLPDVPGLSSAPLEAIRYADIQVVCSDLGPLNLDVPDAASLWAHEEVVEEIHARCDALLPVRFGSTVRDGPRAVALLAGRHDEFVWGLERVRGSVEIAVRAVSENGAHPAVAYDAGPNGAAPRQQVNGSGHDRLSGHHRQSAQHRQSGQHRQGGQHRHGGHHEGSEPHGQEGSDYLRDRATQQRRVEDLAELVHKPLACLARASTRARLVVPPTVMAAAYLAPRESVEEFRASIAAITDSYPGLRLVCTGPWPPYSFTSDSGSWPLGSVAS